MRFILFIALSLHLYAAAPERIIALSPAINEILFALGSGDKIVGNTTYCTYPEQSKKISKVGGYFSPSLEKIITLNPTMVIMQANNKTLSHQLKKLGIQTEVIDIDKLNSIKNAIVRIGHIVERSKKAQQIIRDINRALKSTQNIVQDKKILIVFGHHLDLAKQIFVAGQNLYYDDIITFSGNTNALQSDRKGQPILNLENIIHLNPDIVILISPFTQEKGLSQTMLIKPWLQLPIPAAKTGSVFVETNEYAGIPSHRLKLFIEDFKGFLLEAKNR
jgi:iron complex transport system substrate-binding protein